MTKKMCYNELKMVVFKEGDSMMKRIKSFATTILGILMVTVSAMGVFACTRQEEAPQSFVCEETNLTMELSEDKSFYSVTDCPEDKTEVAVKESYYGKPVEAISESAFEGCENLTKLSIPDCMRSISDKALSACKKLEYTEMERAKYLGNEQNPYVYLAKYISKDVTGVAVENSCKAIGNFAFRACSKLTNVILPEGLLSIGMSAFQGCNFTSINLPNSLKNIDSAAFAYCKQLRSIDIPDGVTKILPNTFNDCTQLASVTIPDGVTVIGMSAFSSCNKLSSISIPASVKSIGPEAFYYCTHLESINFDGTKAKWWKVEKGNLWAYSILAEEIVCTDGTVKIF